MEKMNPEVKADWIAALRSGDYIQGKEELRTKDNTYCCLGVLCDLAVKAGVARWDKAVVDDDTSQWLIMPSDYNFGRLGYSGDVSDSWLPKFIREWSGLLGDNPEVVTDDDGRVGISHLNDNKRMNFHEIAEVIQEQL